LRRAPAWRVRQRARFPSPWPEVVRHRRLEIGGDGFAQVGPTKIAETQRQPIEVLRGTGFAHHIGLRVAELFPDHNNDESEQYRVQHTDGREFEARDLIVNRQPIKRHIATDQSGTHRRQQRAAADN